MKYRLLCGYSKRLPDGSVVRYSPGDTAELTEADLVKLPRAYVQAIGTAATVTDRSIWTTRNLDS